jgi:hypothetical protein
MKTIATKTTFFSKVKLGARRSSECRIFHHLPQTPDRNKKESKRFIWKGIDTKINFKVKMYLRLGYLDKQFAIHYTQWLCYLKYIIAMTFGIWCSLCIKNKFVSPYPTDPVKIGRLKFFYWKFAVTFLCPRNKVGGHINLPLFVRPDIDTWFVRLSPPTVLELQL